MGLTNPIGSSQVAADLDRTRDEAVPLGLTGFGLLRGLVFSSEYKLRTTLIIFTDLGDKAGARSREFNIVYVNLSP
jgi:hypothetical protein